MLNMVEETTIIPLDPWVQDKASHIVIKWEDGEWGTPKNTKVSN